MNWLRAFPVVRTIWKNRYRSRIGQNWKQDLATFKKLDTIANEPHVDDILNRWIFTNNQQRVVDRSLLTLVDALLQVENQYIDPVIRLRAQELASEMRTLLVFVRQNYSLVPEGYGKFSPELRGFDRFDEDRTELKENLEKARRAYKTYRLAVRNRLIL